MVESMGSTVSVISLVVGIVGFCCGIILGPIAIILGAIGMRREENRGMAIAGLVLGIVTFVCWLLAILLLFILLGPPLIIF